MGLVNDQGLEVAWILETHARADHLSAASYLKSKTGAKIGTGKHITGVQSTFKKMFNLGDEFVANGYPFDGLLEDDDYLPPTDDNGIVYLRLPVDTF